MAFRALTPGRRAALASILASIYFLAAALGAHMVNSQYDFYHDYISDYAVGPWGWIYGSAFLASYVGSIALPNAQMQLVP